MEVLLSGVTEDPFVDPKWRELVENCYQIAEALFYEEIEQEVRRAFIAEGESELTALYENYRDALIHAVEGFSSTGADADERLLRSIESRLDVTESQKHQFREEMYLAIHQSQKLRGVDPLRGVPSLLNRALEAKLFEDLRDTMRLTCPDPVTIGWIERAVSALVASGNYCPLCATKAIHRLGTVFRQ
jgi:serine protein kinase